MALVPAALTALGGVAGAFSGGGGTDKVRVMDQVPEFMRDDWKQNVLGLQDDLGNLDPRRYYSGNLTANVNSPLGTSWDQMRQYGNQFGGKIKKNQYGAGLEGRKAMDKGLSFTSQMAQQGPNQFGYNQGVFDQTMGNLMPGLQGAYNAATRDNNRQLNWSTLPGLQMEGVGAGAMGSSKLGQAGALAQGMTADRNADIGSALWMNAANQAQQGAMRAGELNLGSENQFGRDIMGGYQQFANLGLPQLQNAYNTGKTNIGLKNQAGMAMQQDKQNRIDNKIQKYMYNQNAPYNDLAAQMNMVNASLPGGQTVPGQPGMTPWEGAYQGANAMMGIYNAGADAGIWGNNYAQPAAIPPHSAPNNLNQYDPYAGNIYSDSPYSLQG